jgi:hypothetical protein
MKKSRKLLTAVMTIVFLFASTASAFAAWSNFQKNNVSNGTIDTATDSSPGEEKNIQLSRVYLVDETKYKSSDNAYNLEILDEKISQIVFHADVKGETITMGVYWDNFAFSLESLKSEIDLLLEDLNSDEGIVDKPSHRITENDLNIYYYEVIEQTNTNQKSSNIFSQLRHVKKINSIELLNDRPIVPLNQLSSIQAVNSSINGSFHFLGLANEIWWYNQNNGNISLCLPTLSAPHGGDGNARYEAGYQWFPNTVSVYFADRVFQGVSSVDLSYRYDQQTLDNLQLDSNEALEMEVVFYNYNDGHSFFDETKDIVSWFTNQPNAYLDTRLFDNDQEASYCVGVEDANDLIANKSYHWQIRKWGLARSGSEYDGRFKVLAQRSYAVFPMGAPYSIFAEEHDPIRKLGVPVGDNWVDVSAYDLDEWTFDSASDPVQ